MMGKPKGKFAKTRKIVKDYILNTKDLNYAKRKFITQSTRDALRNVPATRTAAIDGLTP